MKIGAGLFVALALMLAPWASLRSNYAEAAAHHEDHPGLVESSGDDGAHQHGDADDHHESPDSPCHHHEAHLCCGSAPVVALAGDEGPDLLIAGHRFVMVEIERHFCPPARSSFHVPIS